jgi:hypothetical protein
MSEDDIGIVINNAIRHDLPSAIKLIFWAGDVRKGLGERRFFRLALKKISELGMLEELFPFIPFYSRWDILFDYEESIPFVAKAFNQGSDGLLFKWLPREGQKHEDYRKKLVKYLGISDKEYRQTCARKSKTVEQKMSANKWSQINYSHVPSIAFSRLRQAFRKHDPLGFEKFVNDAKEGKAKINAAAIHPPQIVRGAERGAIDWAAADAQWKNLPDFSPGAQTLVVCDTSGSMTMGDSNIAPLTVAISLGIYFSERLKGTWEGILCTFDTNPTFAQIKKESTLKEKFQAISKLPWGGTTNIENVFKGMLQFSTNYNIPKEQMPKQIMIISDMEFDGCVGGKTIFHTAKDLFTRAGYELPEIIFWNVNGRIGNVPVKVNEHGVKLISGSSPSVMKFVLEAGADPMSLVNNILNDPRYSLQQQNI